MAGESVTAFVARGLNEFSRPFGKLITSNFSLSGDTIADMGLVCNSSGCHVGNIVHNPYVAG